jgi:hypothetical protein
MTRALNPVFADRPQSIFPTMSALARASALFGLALFVCVCNSAAAPAVNSSIPRNHGLQHCAMPTPPFESACISTSITNLCEALVEAKGGKLEDCLRRDGVGFDRNDLLAPSPYRSVLLLPVELRDEAGVSAMAELSLYVFNTACGPEAAISYFGSSDAEAPLIETEKGVVEIVSPKLRIGLPEARILIDVPSGGIINTFMAPRDHEAAYGYRFATADEVYFAFEGSCSTAPSSKSGILRNMPGMCGALLEKDEHGHMNHYHADEGLASANASDIELAARAAPWAAEYFGKWFKSRVYRVPSQDLLVINTVQACT